MSEFLQAAILAAIQGCLEFLPISSSGHTFIIARLAGWDQFGLLFDATIHLGSLLAVLYYLLRNISSVERSPKWSVTFKGDDDRIGLARLFVLVVVSTIPLVAFGIVVTLLTDDFGRDPNSVSVTLLVTALVLFIAGILARGNGTIGKLSLPKALVIGIAQALAILPGISRSGMTISAAVITRSSRLAAARYSFLLAVPALIGAGGLIVYNGLGANETINWGTLAIGFGVSLVTSLISIQVLLFLLRRFSFYPFAIYALIAGIVLLVLNSGSPELLN